MSYFEFPHTRTYEGDLGYLIKKVIELSESYDKFFKYNTIHFADPIEWDITSQYAAFTIVFDMDNGASYISKQPVPAGITLDNSDYWSFVGPLIVDGEARTEIERILRFLTNIYETSATATAVRTSGTYLVIQGELYKTTATINVGETYTVGINVEKTTIETMIHEIIDSERPIDSILDTTSYNAIANAPVANKFNTVDNMLIDLNEDINEANGEIASLNADIVDLNQSIENERSNREAADGLINTRIDNIIQLTPGSTTGDAELIDGRTAYNGEVFSTIGDAIRNQVQRSIGFNNSGDFGVYDWKTIKCDMSMMHAGANIKWSLYCKRPLLRLKFTPRFVSEDSTTEITSGTFQWYRYKATAISDNADVNLISSGTQSIGQPIQFDNVYPTELIAIVSNYNAYTYNGTDLFGMCYINNSEKVTGVTSFAGNQLVGNCEFVEYSNAMNDKLNAMDVESIDAGLGHTYNNVATTDAGTNVLWGLYVPNAIDNFKFTPEFNYTGSYHYVVYKTEDGNAVANDSTLYKLYEGIKSTGDAIYLKSITPDMFLEINADVPGGVKAIKYSNNKRYTLTNLGYVTKSSIGGALKYQVKAPGTFSTYALAGRMEVLEPKFECKRWGAFGDSLTEYNNRCAHNYVDYVAEDLGLTVKNYGVSGSGYMNSNWDMKAFYQRIQNVDPNDFDFFTILGSINDAISYSIDDLGDVTDTGTTTICGCINTTLANFYSVAPYTPIGIITATPSASQNASDPDCFMSKYTEKLIEIAKLHAIPVLDLYHDNGLRPQDVTFLAQFYTSDVNGVLDTNGIHPNSDGHKMFIAPKVREFIRSLMF